MTLMQIQTVVAVAKNGSVSAAAESLNVSQPNASSAIRSVENELGIKLFRRTGRGLMPTERGYQFVEHAADLLSEYDYLSTMSENQSVFSLRLGLISYTPIVNAFLRLCAETEGTRSPELSYMDLSATSGISMLTERKLDLMACVLPVSYLAHLGVLLEESALTVIPIRPITVTIKLRERHPVLEKGIADNIDALLWELRNYPYVEYSSFSSLQEMKDFHILPGLQCRYFISVDERESRFQLISMSNAFSVGAETSEAQLRRYSLTQLPVPDIEMQLLCFVRRGEENRREIVRYIDNLREEFREGYSVCESLS